MLGPDLLVAPVFSDEGDVTYYVPEGTWTHFLSGQTVTVNYATANGTALAASGDYTAESGTLTFKPGITTQTISVPVISDTTARAVSQRRPFCFLYTTRLNTLNPSSWTDTIAVLG